MSNVTYIHKHRIGDLVQVDLGPQRGVHEGMITARAGRKYRVWFGGGAALTLRACDIAHNLTEKSDALS